MRCFRLALFLSVALPGVILAQSGIGVPPGNIVPNYDRVPVGQREGIEGGAYVARTGDAGSPWYNPAGLALNEKSVINASANAYEFVQVTLEGEAQSTSSTRFAPTGTYIGGVLGSPVIKSPRWRLGFFVAKPVNWDPNILTGSRDSTVGDTREILAYTANNRLATNIPGAAAGVSINQHLRLGFSVGLTTTSLTQDQTISDRYYAPTADTIRIQNLLSDGSTNGMQFTVGAQVDIGSGLMFGAKVVTPSLRLGGKSKVQFNDSEYSNDGTSERLFNDDAARFEYQIPLQLAGGIAFRHPKVEGEVNVRYHAGTDPFDLYSSDVNSLVIVTSPGGPPAMTDAPCGPIVEQWKSVVNVQVGGSVALSDHFRIHAGFYTDNSPVKNPDTSIFRAVDLLGASAGVRLSGGHLSGTVGVAGSWGTSDSRLLGPSTGGASANAKVKIRTFTLLYSLAYAF